MFRARQFEPDGNRVKLVRHKDSRYEEALGRRDWLEWYQRYQSKPVFDQCDQIVVFLGEEGCNSRFVGVYNVGKRSLAADVPLPSNCPYPEWGRSSDFHYDLQKRAGFEDLEDRLVIDWGKAPLSWHQWFTSDREVVEIRPRGRALPPFRDYLRVHLTFEELVRLTAQPEAHRDWVASLSAVGGIYLIVNKSTGKQYVGSATGMGGIWQRWSEYARTGHGDNNRLKELCSQDSKCPGAFSFSILETFSRTLAREEAIASESFFKEKLGTRAFGLNSN